MAILLNGWILPTGGASSGGVWACSLRNRLVSVCLAELLETQYAGYGKQYTSYRKKVEIVKVKKTLISVYKVLNGFGKRVEKVAWKYVWNFFCVSLKPFKFVDFFLESYVKHFGRKVFQKVVWTNCVEELDGKIRWKEWMKKLCGKSGWQKNWMTNFVETFNEKICWNKQVHKFSEIIG